MCLLREYRTFLDIHFVETSTQNFYLKVQRVRFRGQTSNIIFITMISFVYNYINYVFVVLE